MLRSLITIIGIFLFSSTYAQLGNKLKKFSLEEGLSQSSVKDILQDSRGFLWVATEDGLNRYNGYEFIIYRHSSKKKESISNNDIRDIEEDGQGNIWAATSYGLSVWNYNTQTFNYFIPENTPTLKGSDFLSLLHTKDNKLWFVNNKSVGYYDITNKKIISFEHISLGIDTLERKLLKLCEAENGEIWCASRDNGGAAMYNGNKWQEFVYDSTNINSLPSNFIWDIEKAPDGSIWMATSKGLAIYDNNKKSFKRINSTTKPISIPYEDLNDITFDKKGQVWVVMHRHGLAKINLKNKTTTHFTNKKNIGLTSDIIYKITIDNKENLWLTTYFNGLDTYNPQTKTFRNFRSNTSDPYSLSSNNITTVYPGKSGEVWIGTVDAGLNMYNPKQNHFKHVTKNISLKSTLTNTSIRPILIDTKYRTWVGTDDGLNLLLPGEENFINFKFDKKKDGIPDNSINSLFEDSKERIWIGTQNRIAKYEKEKFSIYHFTNANDYFTNNIHTIYEDDQHNIIAVRNNFDFSKYNEKIKKFENIIQYPFLKGRKISCLKLLDKNLILFGTKTNGFYLYNKRTKNYKHYQSNFNDTTTLSHREVTDAILLNDGSLYIATTNGLNLLNTITDEFEHFYIEDGLPNQLIYHLLKDDNENLWMSTNFGLSVLNYETKQFQNFTVDDGLQSNEFNSLAAHSGRNGYLYFGGINGYNYFNPTDVINIRNNTPELYFTTFFVNDKKIVVGDDSKLLSNNINETKQLILNHNQSTFKIGFVAINYTSPEKITYEYALDNPNNWINLQNQQSVSFNRLSPGNYTLYIKAKSSDDEDYQLKILNIIITPPFYATTLFRIAISIFILIVIFVIFKLRTNRIEKQKKALEKQIKERTKEVVHQRDIAIQQKEEIGEQKETIEKKNKEITDSIAYAKRIQNVILPSNKIVKKHLKKSFILYKPKDIVAGDFYWMEHQSNKILFAAADCTGHGVPGAMVSVVCNNALNRAVREYGLVNPGEILDKTREIVIAEFGKSDDAVSDGMDIAICSLEGNKLNYAGANNPLWIIRNEELIIIKANKQPIGNFHKSIPYKTELIELKKGDTIYIFTDGYVDQFGGNKGKKLKSNAFKALLLSIQHQTMEQQKIALDKYFEEWKEDLEQVDDVCVIGVRI